MLPETRLPEIVMVAVLSQPGRVRVCEPCPLITVMLSDLGDCHLAHLNWPTHRVCPPGAAAVAGAVAAAAGVLAAAFLASSSAFFLASSAFFSSAFFCSSSNLAMAPAPS